MREITAHQVKEAPSQLRILVLDEPGAGGANHLYEIIGFTNDPLIIGFQNGSIAEKGTNGVTQEALLAIVVDRLESFQSGPFPSAENNMARLLAGCALDALKLRTERRVRQGTEGHHKEIGTEKGDAGMGVLALVHERFRQNTEKGYTLAHDDLHTQAELLRAAQCYMFLAKCQIAGDIRDITECPPGWPFEKESWRASDDPQRNLAKAGALIAAEWDRLERLGSRAGKSAVPPLADLNESIPIDPEAHETQITETPSAEAGDTSEPPAENETPAPAAGENPGGAA